MARRFRVWPYFEAIMWLSRAALIDTPTLIRAVAHTIPLRLANSLDHTARWTLILGWFAPRHDVYVSPSLLRRYHMTIHD
ncbi:hypothetical protein J3E69DRAFT_336849 [Trichoderma sp. SZMC 28015]